MWTSDSRTGCGKRAFRASRVAGLVWLIAWALPSVAAAQTLTLAEVLFRASQAAVRLEREFGNQVVDETYEQRVVSSDGEVKRTRQLSSSLLFFRAPDADTWTSFRNVLEIDGEFTGREWIDASETPPTVPEFLESAARRNRAGQRNHLGEAPRALHMPLLALTFLHPLNSYRSNFEKVGQETRDGRPVWLIRFSEHRQPPFVQVTGPTEGSTGDMFASGTFWVDAEGGHVVRSELLLGGSGRLRQARAQITATFERLDDTDVWAPVEMEETYDDPTSPDADRIEGTVRYSGFRSLSLMTGELPPNQH